MLALVPLARSRREMTNVNREVQRIGETLKFGFPHVRAIAVAPICVGRDEEVARLQIALRADARPPRLDRDRREPRRVVIDADVDAALIGRDGIDAGGDRLADGVAGNVMDVDERRLALRLPLTSSVLEVADTLLLLVSTEMNGWPRAIPSCAVAARCSNCACRAGCGLPSTVFFGA